MTRGDISPNVPWMTMSRNEIVFNSLLLFQRQKELTNTLECYHKATVIRYHGGRCNLYEYKDANEIYFCLRE
jgi:hypothetical protein